VATNPPTQYEHDMRVLTVKAQVFGAHLQAVVNFASLALKSAILGNSASAGAVLVFLAPVWGKAGADKVAMPALFSVRVFATGIFAGIVAAMLSYLAQFCYSRMDVAKDGSDRQRAWERAAIPFHSLALVISIVSVACFGIGAWFGVDALEAAKGGFGIAP
jgi:hypothetical protein